MRRLAAATVTVATIAATAPAAFAAPISKATRFQSNGGAVTCGIEIHAPGKPATDVLCAAKGIPAPKQPGVGDPGLSRSTCSGNHRSCDSARIHSSPAKPPSSAAGGYGISWA